MAPESSDLVGARPWDSLSVPADGTPPRPIGGDFSRRLWRRLRSAGERRRSPPGPRRGAATGGRPPLRAAVTGELEQLLEGRAVRPAHRHGLEPWGELDA